MSRIGRKPVPIASGVKVDLSTSAAMVRGPKGTLEVGSQNEAIGRVKEMGLFPTKIVELDKEKPAKGEKKVGGARPAAKAKKYGSFTRGEGNPVMAPSLSRICFSVRFSPPRM